MKIIPNLTTTYKMLYWLLEKPEEEIVDEIEIEILNAWSAM
jgi:hypothetical protein